MIPFEAIQSFVNTVSVYSKHVKLNDKGLLESFVTYQYKRKQFSEYNSSELAKAYNYAIVLIFVKTGIEYKNIRESDVSKFVKHRSIWKRMFGT